MYNDILEIDRVCVNTGCNGIMRCITPSYVKLRKFKCNKCEAILSKESKFNCLNCKNGIQNKFAESIKI